LRATFRMDLILALQIQGNGCPQCDKWDISWWPSPRDDTGHEGQSRLVHTIADGWGSACTTVATGDQKDTAYFNHGHFNHFGKGSLRS
jgi:hypothetical protein